MNVNDKRVVAPLEDSGKRHKHLTFDIETYDDSEGRKQFKYGAVYNGYDDVAREFTTAEAMRDYLLHSEETKSAWIWAHNAEFDMSILGLLDAIEERQRVEHERQEDCEHCPENMGACDQGHLIRSKNVNSGGYMFSMYHDRTRIRRFVDSMNFFVGMSLDAVTEQFNVERKGDFDYELIGEDMSDDDIQRMRDYCIRDCRVLWQAIMTFETQIIESGGQLNISLASTSLDIFRRRFQSTTQTCDPEYMELCDRGRFGGVTLAFVNADLHGTYNAHKIDINSSYPYQMMRGVPSASDMYRPPRPKVEHIREEEGMAEVTVHIPEDELIPILPVKHDSKLFFPCGTVRGTWTHHELRMALSRGYEVRAVHEQVIAPYIIEDFKEFVTELYRERKEYEAEDNYGSAFVRKIILNSLYGKWCQNDIEQTVNCSIEEADEYGYMFNSDGERVMIGQKTTETIPIRNNHPIVGAYITAMGRTQLFSAMRTIREHGGTVLYCDTDSIAFSGCDPESLPLTFDPDTLGAWDIEDRDNEFEIIREKMYRIKDRNKVKLKGVPDAYADKAFSGEPVSMERFIGYKESLQRDETPMQTEQQTKQVARLPSEKRVMTPNYSRPFRMEELRERSERPGRTKRIGLDEQHIKTTITE